MEVEESQRVHQVRSHTRMPQRKRCYVVQTLWIVVAPTVLRPHIGVVEENCRSATGKFWSTKARKQRSKRANYL